MGLCDKILDIVVDHIEKESLLKTNRTLTTIVY